MMRKLHFSCAQLSIFLAFAFFSHSVTYAAAITKADTPSLNSGADWVGAAAPGPLDTATFTNTLSAANAANLSLNANLRWLGVTVGTVNGPLIFNAGNTLTLGQNGGINMSAATGDLTLNCGLTLLGTQSWTAAAGRTLTLGTPNHAGSTVSFTGFAGSSTLTNTNLIIGPWATIGATTAMQYATSSAGLISGFTGTAARTAADVVDMTGAVNYELASGGALGAGASLNTLRYTGTAAGTVTGNFAANGLMNVGAGAVTYSGAVTIGSNRELVILGPSNTTISGIISNNAGGASALTYSGTGTLAVSAASTFTG